MSDLPTATYDVHHERNTGRPTGRKLYGIGVLVVVSGRESRLHGKAGEGNEHSEHGGREKRDAANDTSQYQETGGRLVR